MTKVLFELKIIPLFSLAVSIKKRNFAAINYKMNNDYDGNITSCLLYMQALYGCFWRSY